MNPYWFEMAAAALLLLTLFVGDLLLFPVHSAPKKGGWRLDLVLFLWPFGCCLG